MKFLRTVSTRRLLTLIATLVAAIVAGSAIAVAAGSSGPKPPAKPLAQAVHQALAAPAVMGVTAQISFSNHLIPADNINGSDPLLSGTPNGRLWVSNDRVRIELQSDNGDAELLVSNGSFSVYDPSSHTLYKGKLPADLSGSDHAAKPKNAKDTLPTVAQIQSYLTQLMGHANVSSATPSDVAQHATYTVTISPKHDGGLLGSAQLAWDAAKGVPLRIAVYARGTSNPVLELKATNISYGPVSPSAFSIRPPAGANIVSVATPANAGAQAKAANKAKQPEITGAKAVASHLSFPLRAPAKLVGLPQQSVSLLNSGGTPGALVTYGQNLGGIAVIERKADKSNPQPSQAQGGDQQSGVTLPSVSINGASGRELATALGTVLTFTRNGVSYTVLGSVPPAAAELAARGL